MVDKSQKTRRRKAKEAALRDAIRVSSKAPLGKKRNPVRRLSTRGSKQNFVGVVIARTPKQKNTLRRAQTAPVPCTKSATFAEKGTTTVTVPPQRCHPNLLDAARIIDIQRNWSSLNLIVEGLTATQPLTQTQTPPPTPPRDKAGSSRLPCGLQPEVDVQRQPQLVAASTSELPVDFDASWIQDATPPPDDDIVIVSEQEPDDLDLDGSQALSAPRSVTVPENTSHKLEMMVEMEKRTTKRIDGNMVQTWRYINKLQRLQEAQGISLQMMGGVKAALEILVDCERERRDEAAAVTDGQRRVEAKMTRMEEKMMRIEEYFGRIEGELAKIKESLAGPMEEQRRVTEANHLKMQKAALLLKQLSQTFEELGR